MKVKDMAKKNTQLRRELEAENAKYYHNLLMNMRLKGGFLSSEEQVERILLITLEALLDAQKNGMQAVVYFRKSPKQLADSMLKEISPASLFEKIRLITNFLGIYALLCMIPCLYSANNTLDIGGLVLTSMMIFLLAWGILEFIYISFILNIDRTTKTAAYISFSVCFGFVIFLQYFFPSIYAVKLEGGLGIAVIILLIIASTFFCLREEKFRTFLFIIYSFGAVNIANRISNTATYLDTKYGKILVVFTLSVSVIAFIFTTFFHGGRAR